MIYGPVRSADIKDFMANGMKADSKMRKVTFGLRDRLTVSVLELVMALEKMIPVSAVLSRFMPWLAGGFSLKADFAKSFYCLCPRCYLAVLTGTVFIAALLPYLPGKAFSIKGGFLGAAAGF